MASSAAKKIRTEIGALDPAVLVAVPQIDRARAFVEEMRRRLDDVNVAFARYDQAGNATEVVLDERVDEAQQMEWLRAERLLARGANARVGRPAFALPPGRHGLAATYAQDDRLLGILVAIAEKPLGAAAQRMLEETLKSGSALLARISAFDGELSARERARERAVPAQFLLSRDDFSVRFAFIPQSDGLDPVHEMLGLTGGPPPAVIETVRTLTAAWTDDPRTHVDGVAIPLPFMLVRVWPAQGEGRDLIGVTVERFRSRGSLSYAARKFGMSSRELQVLALVLQGLGTPEIARTLAIAESTAHDHIKRMLVKARARNRVELAAKALGWRGA